MGQSLNDLPDFIELYPDATGSFGADFNRPAPAPAPIAPYVNPESLPLYREPIAPAPPRPPQPTTGGGRMSDADIADFGVDEYGRPVVTRDPDGRPRFNPDSGFSPDELRRADRALDDVPNTRAVRRGLGHLGADLIGIVPVVGDVIGFGIDAYLLGDELGWWGEPDTQGQPGGDVTIPGAGGYPQGQCEGVLYGVTIRFRTIAGYNGQQAGAYFGPIGGAFVVPGSNLPHIISGNPPVSYAVGSASSQVPAVDSIISVDAQRLDGLPDVCGQPLPGQGPSNPPTTNPDGTPQPFPNPFPNPSPDLNGDGLPDGVPFPDFNGDGWPDGVPRPDGWPNPFPDLDGDGFPAPYPDVLPDPLRDPPEAPPDTTNPDPSTPDDGCCPASTLSLAEIKRLLERALGKLEGKGKAIFDLAPCESEIDPLNPPDPLAGLYEGEGLTGVYAAIAAITKSLNLVRADTKCLEGSNAALPMYWEIKSGEIPQFSVLWKPAEGGNSRWAMSVPHPRADLGKDFLYSFPTYQKGPNMANMKLLDNSKIIINVASKGEAAKVMNYAYSLIDPAFRPETIAYTYSENVSTARIVTVSACYIKKFAGHTNVAPLWARAL
jgi:hypothetical protein